jgi:hypothetical protein
MQHHCYVQRRDKNCGVTMGHACNTTSCRATSLWAWPRKKIVAWDTRATPPTDPIWRRSKHATPRAQSKSWHCRCTAPPPCDTSWRARQAQRHHCHFTPCECMFRSCESLLRRTVDPASQRHAAVQGSALFNIERWEGTNTGLFQIMPIIELSCRFSSHAAALRFPTTGVNEASPLF